MCSQNVPLVKTKEEFIKHFQGLTALSVPNSTFDENLDSLEQYIPHLKRECVKNVDEVFEKIQANDNYYSYVELIPYLMQVQRGSVIKIFWSWVFNYKKIK